MKRILILVALVVIAGIAGIVRSHTHRGDFDRLVSHNVTDQAREEIRQSYQLSPGASVDLSNINGSIKIETSDTNTAEVYVERFGSSQEALSRRKVVIEANGNSLKIRGEKSDVGFFERFFGNSPSERITLKLPGDIALHTKGVNGAVTVGPGSQWNMWLFRSGIWDRRRRPSVLIWLPAGLHSSGAVPRRISSCDCPRLWILTYSSSSTAS